MENILQTTLTSVIQQLANFFGMTTDVIMQNAPEWLAKYGWFSLLQEFPTIILLWALIDAMCLGIYITLSYGRKEKLNWKFITIFIIISAVIIFGVAIVQCAISPELYGLKALLALLNK